MKKPKPKSTGGTRPKLAYLRTLARVAHYLESGRPFTSVEIAQATGDNPRTVQRYLDELRGLGFRTELVPVPGRGGYQLRGVGSLTIEQAIAGLLAECRG